MKRPKTCAKCLEIMQSSTDNVPFVPVCACSPTGVTYWCLSIECQGAL